MVFGTAEPAPHRVMTLPTFFVETPVKRLFRSLTLSTMAFQPVEVRTDPGVAVGIAAFQVANAMPAKHTAAIAPAENSMPLRKGRE